MGSGLFYHGTEIEVQIGDRVSLQRLLRKSQDGVVTYIPGISQPHSELEYRDVKQWAIKTDDGSVYPILYDPENFQPPKHIKFVSRSREPGMTPEQELL